ncbi:MAG: DUF1570 domain-containing protein [Planctomycetes bacterium]|nr:DUF1570 domain-containing protein [Planctomycetota bacterium]
MKRTLLPLVLALAFAIPAPAQAKAQPFIDLDNGIAVMPPDKWKCIPTPKEMKYQWLEEEKVKMIAKWEAPQADADNYSVGAELNIIRDTKDLDAAIKEYTSNQTRGGREFDIKKQQDFMIAGKLKARWVLAHVPSRSGSFGYLVAFFSDGEKAFAMEFHMSAARIEKKIPDWMKNFQSFKFLNEKEIAALAKIKPPLLPGWQVHKTKNYDIQFNCPKAFAVLVGNHMEAILLEYQKYFPLDSFGGSPALIEGKENQPVSQKTTLERMTVKMFNTNDEFQSYANSNGVGGAAAYFSPAQNELVGYMTKDQGKDLSIHIMYHEAMHQYLHALFGEEVRIPIWLNEGMAEYFFGGEFSEQTGRFSIGPNKVRIDTIRQAARDGSFVPLKKLFQYTQAQYYSNAGLCYAQGWSVAYFLWTTKDPKYQGVIENFMKLLRQTKDGEKAFNESFGKLDIDQLEADWKAAVVKF